MTDRARRGRQPLAELSNITNTPVRQNGKGQANTELPVNLPHNVSFEANGSLVARSQPSSPEHRRVSKIVSEDEAWKRNSAVSTTSTNASGRKRKAYIGHWQLGKTIGKGGCSRVRAVRHRYTRQYGAVKIIARSTAESTRAQSLANLIESCKGNPTVTTSGYKPIPFGLEREIALMKLLEHKNIVRLYDVWENRNELYLIMEYVEGGELFHFVEQRRGLSEMESVIIFRQIIAALLYCHRLHICHRDLKPENILISQERLEVKLIDFGMAALQPQGRMLSTPCGSPHYAAPEVVSARPYDGKTADAWSCGVILYVMLTGTTPYNYSQNGDIRGLFADISRAKYVMPQELSIEAKDLIKRIFVPDPKYRISMDGIWEHPLLHKYDDLLAAEGCLLNKEEAIGPVPRLEDWTIQRAQDVDREILRNMRTLWHSEPESGLVAKLLNKEHNQEKIFYAALMKHREENLENYIGEYDHMTYSASDYHHSHPIQNEDVPPVPLHKSQSQYSIMNDEHLRPSHSFVEPPPSVNSYDPYRSSRDPIVRGNDHVSVIVHRNSSKKGSARASLRQNKSLRVGMLKHNNRGALHSNSSLSRSRSSLPRSSLSKHSLSTTNWPSSPPVIAMRPSELHKRGVSFNHVRRTSTPSALLSQASTRTTPATPGKSSKTLDSPASPHGVPEQIVRSKKAQLVQTPRLKTRKGSDTPSQAVRSDIRKHSLELEKACEEAFFRSSVGSGTAYSPSTDHASPAETPASTVSGGTPDMVGKPARPLPDLPSDTPTTFLTRTLKEFRAKLAAYRPPGETDEGNFGEVMKLIDDLVPAQQKHARRMMSAPETRIPDHLGHGLPIISEESNSEVQKFRSFTAPTQDRRCDQTIRMVPISPASVAPLNIRKRGDAEKHLSVRSHDPLRRQRSHDATEMLEAIDENEVLPSPVVRKKKSWFGLSKKAISQPVQKRVSLVEAETNALPHDTSISADSSEFPMRKKAGKRGIGKWLGRLNGKETEDETSKLHDGVLDHTNLSVDTIAFNQSMDSLFSTSSPTPSVNRPTVQDKGRSWFTRFFNIKPAQKLLCFNIPRGRARQELIILFKEWQRHGIRDLQYSRETQTIIARVDRNNSLDIKPVTFRIELFVVLEHGRRVGLSIARFTQIKGAASAFKKVIEVVDGVFRTRNWLVEDEEKWKALCDIIDVF